MSLLLSSSTAPLQPGITTKPQETTGGSAISSPHPDYSARRPDWVTMFDTNEGQRHIKSKTTTYLPATSGMRALGLGTTEEGYDLYQAYLTRAFFPDLVKETVRALVGILNREAANIELPDALEDMRAIATSKGESLDDLLVSIHMNQLLYGRTGLLLDVDEQRDLPLVVCYPGPQILNWDDLTMAGVTIQDEEQRNQALRKLLLIVLDETRYERETGNAYEWNLVSRYRALTLGEAGTTYQSELEREGALQAPVIPQIRGRTLDEIPFTCINTTDLATKPGEVPLINLANLALAIYRGEADHRSALFMSGQDTLVLLGYDPNAQADPDANPTSDAKPIIGSGAYLALPDPEADAKFIGPDSQALAEQRTSLEDDYKRAGEEGIKLLSSGAGAEAAETLRIRVAARTATLQTIAITAAAGLENALRQAATWVGANPDDVRVEPNLDFVAEMQDPAQLMQFAQAKRAGVPLSWRSIHNWLRQKDYTELTLEEEIEEIEREEEEIESRITGRDNAGEPGVDPLEDPAMAQARQAAAQACQAPQPGQEDEPEED